MYKTRVLLLSASPYSMTNEETGELVEGVSLRYLTDEHLEPSVTDGVVGVMPAKTSVDSELIEKIEIAPAYYDVEFDIKVNARGQATLKAVGLEFAGAVAVSLKPLKPDELEAIKRKARK